MNNNSAFKLYRYLKSLLVYQPPQLPETFILQEQEDETHEGQDETTGKEAKLAQLNRLLVHAKRLAKAMEDSVQALQQQGKTPVSSDIIEEIELLEEQQVEINPLWMAYTSSTEAEKRIISSVLTENEKLLKKLYNLPKNKDAVIRNFTLPFVPPLPALLIYLDGMIDKKVINEAILKPLLAIQDDICYSESPDLAQTIADTLLPSNQVQITQRFNEAMDGVNSGDTALLVDGMTAALVIDTKGYDKRSIDRPQLEQSVRGGQASFTENLRTNTAQIRVTMPTNDLVTEMILVGERIPMKCAVMYLQSVANETEVAEVKRRIEGIRTDYISSVGVLVQFIEDHPNIPFPQSLSTERVDRIAVHLAEGRIAVLLDGSPFVHILPTNLFTFFQSSEDFNLPVMVATGVRLLRWIGTVLAIILPALYLAINYFHQEALPTDLALAIAGAREKVPFPALVEILLMEFSFELIREAGIRVPGVLGSTIGIVGAIILGQAAVSANIVSPIMVVLVALTGVASFTIPDYRMAFALRIYRFVLLLLAAALGFVGIAFGMIILTVLLTSMKSFGVPYLSPLGPRTRAGLDVVFRGPVYRQEKRPDELNPKDIRRQPGISRVWKTEKPVNRR